MVIAQVTTLAAATKRMNSYRLN